MYEYMFFGGSENHKTGTRNILGRRVGVVADKRENDFAFLFLSDKQQCMQTCGSRQKKTPPKKYNRMLKINETL